MREFLRERFGISEEICKQCEAVEEEIAPLLFDVDKKRDYNQLKVLAAMQDNAVAERHLYGSTGYGYDDIGRDTLDAVYAQVLGTEDALVRIQMISGTHALTVCMFGILRPGDEVVSVSGKPYDTLEEVIGIRAGKLRDEGSLIDFGVTYKQVDLIDGDRPDYAKIAQTVTQNTKMVIMQRSVGYALRTALSIDTIGQIIKTVKEINPKVIVMVDNCYGEFVDTREPGDVGADLVVGSLIKNPGGTLAPCGGYIAGKREYVEKCAYRLTAPGLGKHVGATLGHTRQMMQGYYLAPHIVGESIKGAIFTAALLNKYGYETKPAYNAQRSDIVQAIILRDPRKLEIFCKEIQKAAPVDSYVTPESAEMPGYEAKVIMAAGAFVQGSSIELSADGPMIPPYIAFMQGGIVYANIKLAAAKAVEALLKSEPTK